jgi:DNA polymerase
LRRSSEVLESIAAEVRACRLCPLANGRDKAVPGEGPPHAHIMLVGEGPGREEDQSGRPFVGRAGKLLTRVLESAGLSRDEAFITNVVKCRPPKNRQPTKRERETCRDAYLIRQVHVIAPRLVILLGRTAAKAILGADSLKKVRGRVIGQGSVEYLSTYHPAALLRNPRLKGTSTKDLRVIRRISRYNQHRRRWLS